MMASSSTSYVLGMDIGTTSIKVVLLDAQLRCVTDRCALPTNADIVNKDAQVMEQDPGKIIDTLNQCISSLPRDKLQNVTKIGVSGQMHGVVFWKSNSACYWDQRKNVHMFWPKDVSQLVTWQDGRCSIDFLSSLPKPDSHLSVATGFGCATIFWCLRNRPEYLTEFTTAGTIHDYVVTMLCGLDNCLMSTQNAASWGYFNTSSKKWNLEILCSAGFPARLLPRSVPSGSCAGHTCSEWHGIPAGTAVGAALGDFQCAVYSCMEDSTHAVLNISTSAQLTFAMPADFKPPSVPNPASPVSYFPYFDGCYLAVAASLNGGNTVSTFVDMLTAWMKELGVEVNGSSIYSQLIEAGLGQSNTDLKVRPTVLGERHDTSCLGLVSNMSTSNLSLGHVTRALCQGIVENITTMLPPKTLVKSGVKRIVGSGSALLRNEILRQETERVFPFPVQYSEDVDSAVGVAMLVNDRM